MKNFSLWTYLLLFIPYYKGIFSPKQLNMCLSSLEIQTGTFFFSPKSSEAISPNSYQVFYGSVIN